MAGTSTGIPTCVGCPRLIEGCDTALFPSLGHLVGQGVGKVMMSSRTDFNRATAPVLIE